MFVLREKSSQSKNPRIFALRDEKNRQVCLMDSHGGKLAKGAK